MSKRIALFCALLGAVAFLATPAYAEVQNIKVSGDIQVLGVFRDNYDLEDGQHIQDLAEGEKSDRYIADDADSLFESIVKLRVDADLTDNVAATVRLANVREWDAADNDGTSQDDNDIVLDLAYITLKEMLYSPLTLVIGRQELYYGTGLILGPGRFQDSNAVLYDDLVPLHGFDAIRGILDYDPWTLDLLAIKITEGDDDTANTPAAGADDDRDSDIDVYGANLAYQFDDYDAEMEGYVFYKRDPRYNLAIDVEGSESDERTFTKNDVLTLGLRGSVVPTDNLTVRGEVAGQIGEIKSSLSGATGGELTRDRQAMLGNIAAEYDFTDIRFKPVLGVEYLYLSGEEAGNDGDFEAWDPMYRSRFIGTIRDALESLYTTADRADTSGWTNQNTVKFSGSLDLAELVDGLSLDVAYLRHWFSEEPIAGADDNIGDEIIARLSYDYTEDVEFFIDGAWFIPGDYYDEIHNIQPMSGGGLATSNTVTTRRVANDTAVSIIGSCKVTF